MIEQARELLLEAPWATVGIAAGTIVGGYFLAKFLSYFVGRQVERNVDETTGLAVRKLVFYGLLVGVLTVFLGQLDVSFGALLAAGGLLGVALGFASQTAVSNVISGLFLIFERPFEVSDAIRVDGQFGVVESIDLLSTKIRTFDNLLWRMPNEKLLKSDIYNITRYDVRRRDLVTSIAYGDDIQVARDALLECADDNPKVLVRPEPVTLVNSMGESGIELTLRFWFEREDFLEVGSEMTQQVKGALEEAGCTIPFPHRTVYFREEPEWQRTEEQNRRRQAEKKTPPND